MDEGKKVIPVRDAFDRVMTRVSRSVIESLRGFFVCSTQFVYDSGFASDSDPGWMFVCPSQAESLKGESNTKF